ncbi:MAG: elongation factor P 5-aminopentanone reductase [Acutalibacteraceae bacterium]
MSKLAFITGASGEIGSAICRRFAENGYDIAAHYFKNEEAAEKLCRQLEGIYHIRAKAFGADFSKPEQVKALCENVSRFGSVYALVNNAGIAYSEVFQLVSDEKAQEIYSVNMQSAMSVTKYILPQMIRMKCGRIINISSMWGVSGGSCEVHYSASKAALIGFTKALCKEVGPSGITVNCIAPGLIDTKMNANLSSRDIKEIVEQTPVERIGTPDDVAALALFLSGEEASFITGQVICVDGGLSV